jgi:hypothetical protein
MKRLTIVFAMTFLVLITACGAEKDTSSQLLSSYSDTSSSDLNVDLASYMEISNVSMRTSGTLYYMVGEIKNTYTSSVDEIADLAMYDDSGKLVKVKKIIVKLAPGETMAFDELIGIDTPASSVKLMGM